jgi:hypothetical protein
MQYMRSYNYIFENPNWLMNVVWGGLCFLSATVIPYVGQLVYLGYQIEVLEALTLNRGTRYPDFDINRFGDYLGRSIWPFLAALVAGLVMVPVMLILMFVTIFGCAGIGAAVGGGGGNGEIGGIIAMLGMILGFLLTMAIAIGMNIVVMPMMIRAGLAQEFGAAFEFGWIKDFLKKTWVEMILAMLFLGITSLLLSLLGMLACFVGLFAVIPIVSLAQAHLWYQLYMLYLSRGGTPVPLKPQTPPVTQPAYVPPQQY